MNLQFNYINIREFKSIPEARLELNRGAGLHFVRGENLLEPRLGSNGAGKSTLFDAMTWCLYGKTAGGLRNPDIIPWGEKKGSPSVTVVGEKDGEGFAIVRTANPNQISLNDEYLGQEDLDHFLGLNFDLFTNTIMLAQGQPLFFDLPPRGKMELFTQALELDQWDQRSERASEQADKWFRKVADAETQLVGLRSELESVEELLVKYAARSEEWKEEKAAKLKEYQRELKEASERLKRVGAKADEASVQYDYAMTELKALRKSHKPLLDRVRETEYALNEAEREIDIAEREMKQYLRSIENLKESVNCPTCGQKVKQENFKKHKAELQEKIDGLKPILAAGVPATLTEEYESAKNEYANVEKAEQEFEEKAEKWREQMDFHTPEKVRAEAAVNRFAVAIDELEREENPYREQTTDMKKRIKLLKEDIDDGLDYMDKARRKAERAKYWVKGFKDIRLFVIEDVLEELTLTSKIMLEELGLVEWDIRFDIEKETKSGTVKRGINVVVSNTSTAAPVKWEAWSGGERQRLRLISALALSEVLLSYAGIQTNIEVLDEPTRHLSKEGIWDTWRYLEQRSEQLDRSCFYVDHQFAESARFASVVLVSKSEDGTTVTEE